MKLKYIPSKVFLHNDRELKRSIAILDHVMALAETVLAAEGKAVKTIEARKETETEKTSIMT